MNQSIEERLMETLVGQSEKVWGLKELLGALGLSSGEDKTLRRTLKRLVKDGRVERHAGRRYRLSRVGRLVEGRVHLEEERGAMLEVQGAGPKEPMVFIAKEDWDLLDEGAIVRCELQQVGSRGRVVARVQEILRAPKTRGLGTFRILGKATLVEPESRRKKGAVEASVLIESDDSLQAKDGDLVEFEITRRRTTTHTAYGRVVRILGTPGDRETEIRRIIARSEIPTEFSRESLEQARSFGDVVRQVDIEARRDLRQLRFVTIDSETARDFDDAVCVEKAPGGFRLYVAIADVTHYVTRGSPLDQESMMRGTSVYLPDRVIPMLPEELSNNLCSLKPNVDRLAVVAEMVIDHHGVVTASSFYRATIHSKARLTYTQVAAALDGEPDDVCKKLLPSILRMYKVAQSLLTRRLKHGSIDLDLPEAEIVFDESGFPTDVVRRGRNEAHRLIEDLMLSANQTVAAYFVEQKLPTVFRVHGEPDPDKLEAFIELAEELGIHIPKRKKKARSSPKDIARLLDELNEHPKGKPLNTFLLRSLAQARYYPENEGHFGLAFDHYLHFTSPIRRYPDLMVHRLLMQQIERSEKPYAKQELTSISEESSQAERRAMEVERSSKDLDRALVATAHVGEELRGQISGLQNFGAFVMVDRPFIEGFIPIQYLGDDYFELDRHGASLRGSRTGREIRIGDTIDITITSVNVERGRVELRLVGMPTSSTGRTDRPRGRRPGPQRSRDDRRSSPRSSRGRQGSKRRGR